jgi:DoxX-like family
MKKPKLIAYWICTAIVALCIGAGGLAQALRVPQNVEGMMALGYPLHFIVLLGVWKVLGALTLLAPGLRLVKEWAYAGIFIDLSGAIVTAVANGSAAFHVVAPLVLIGLLAASWALRPESRRLPGATMGAVDAASRAPLLDSERVART